MSTTLTLEHVIGFLLDAPMFGDLDEPELSEVVQIMQIRRLRAGQLLFREGDIGDAWYVVFEGAVEVVKDGGTHLSRLADLGPPACFGEMAILDGSPRSATVRALAETTLLRFPRDAFQGLLEAHNLAAYKLVHQMARLLAARQRRTTSQLAEMLDAGTPAPVQRRLGPIVEDGAVSE